MKRFKKENQKGFTLVEVMAVTAIIGMMTAMSLPNFIRMKVTSNESAAEMNLKELGPLMEDYRFVNGSYPANGTQLTNFVNTYYRKQSIISNPSSDTWVFQGYRYTYVQLDAGSWEWTATPQLANITGSRVFVLRESGFIGGGPIISVARVVGIQGNVTATVGTGDNNTNQITFDGDGGDILSISRSSGRTPSSPSAPGAPGNPRYIASEGP